MLRGVATEIVSVEGFTPTACGRFCNCEGLRNLESPIAFYERASTDSKRMSWKPRKSTVFNNRLNLVRDQEVGGSNPLAPTIFFNVFVVARAGVSPTCGGNSLLHGEQSRGCRILWCAGVRLRPFVRSLRIRNAQIFLAPPVKAVAAPNPVLRVRHESSPHRIEVHVVHLLVLFLRAPHVEIVEPPLPKVRRSPGHASDDGSQAGLRRQMRRRKALSHAAKFESELDRNYTQYVNWYYTSGPGSDWADPVTSDMGRQCALGNPAACP